MMVYNGKTLLKFMIWGGFPPIFGNTHMSWHVNNCNLWLSSHGFSTRIKLEGHFYPESSSNKNQWLQSNSSKIGCFMLVFVHLETLSSLDMSTFRSRIVELPESMPQRRLLGTSVGRHVAQQMMQNLQKIWTFSVDILWHTVDGWNLAPVDR